MHRCATGEHRGYALAETLAALTATAAGIISDEDPGWETMRAIVWSARDVWPHLCVACCGMPLCAAGRECWQP